MTGSDRATAGRGARVVAGTQRSAAQCETGTARAQRRRTALALSAAGSADTVPCPDTAAGSCGGDGRRTAGTGNRGRIGRDGDRPGAPSTELLAACRLGNRAACGLAAMTGSIGDAPGRGTRVVRGSNRLAAQCEPGGRTADGRSGALRTRNRPVGEHVADGRAGKSGGTARSGDGRRTCGDGDRPCAVSDLTGRLGDRAARGLIGFYLFKCHYGRPAFLGIFIFGNSNLPGGLVIRQPISTGRSTDIIGWGFCSRNNLSVHRIIFFRSN